MSDETKRSSARGQLFVRIPFRVLDSPVWAWLGPDCQAVWLKLLSYILRVTEGRRDQTEAILDYKRGLLVASIRQQRLADETGLGRTSVIKAIRRLHEIGFIPEVASRGPTRRGGVRKYVLGYRPTEAEVFEDETLAAEYVVQIYDSVAEDVPTADRDEIISGMLSARRTTADGGVPPADSGCSPQRHASGARRT
jgi:predicted transcriptional regulator